MDAALDYAPLITTNRTNTIETYNVHAHTCMYTYHNHDQLVIGEWSRRTYCYSRDNSRLVFVTHYMPTVTQCGHES